MDQYEQFWHDGFMVLDTGLSEKTIDHLIKNVKPFWQDKKPHGSGYHDSNRVQDAWYSVPEVKQVATHPLIVDTLRKLYGRTPLPFQTLNFKKGTGQRPHADSIHFNSEPFGLMCGVWVALEDVVWIKGLWCTTPEVSSWERSISKMRNSMRIINIILSMRTISNQ